MMSAYSVSTKRSVVVAVLATAVLATTSLADGLQIYVPNFLDGDVSVLDADTLSTITRIPILDPPGSFPEAVAFSPDGSFAFISLSGANEVVVIDTETQTVTNHIPIAFRGDPLIFARPGGDRIYVTNCFAPRGIAVIDIATQTAIDVDPATPELDTITMPHSGWSMGFSPDGLFAYASHCDHAGGAGIVRIDLTENVFHSFIPLGPGLVNHVAVSPNGQLAIATNGGSLILVVDLAQMLEVGRIEVPGAGTQGVEFNADGSRAYVVSSRSFSNNLFTIDVTTPSNPQLLSVVPVVTSGHLWELEVDGNRAYLIAYDCVFSSQVIAFDITTDTPVQLATGDVGRCAFEIGLRPQAQPESPSDLLIALIQSISELNLQQGIENSLDAKLDAASQALEDINENNDVAAVNALQAFINAVEAQSGNHIPVADADTIIADAQEIIDLLLAE